MAATRPDAVALILPDETLSYCQLLDRSHTLAQQLECAQGTVLALQAEAMAEMALSVHAASLLGRAFFPLNLALTPQQRDPLLQAAGGSATDDIELFIATSGTQGEPKAVMLGGANLQAGVLASRSRLPLQAGCLAGLSAALPHRRHGDPLPLRRGRCGGGAASGFRPGAGLG